MPDTEGQLREALERIARWKARDGSPWICSWCGGGDNRHPANCPTAIAREALSALPVARDALFDEATRVVGGLARDAEINHLRREVATLRLQTAPRPEPAPVARQDALSEQESFDAWQAAEAALVKHFTGGGAADLLGAIEQAGVTFTRLAPAQEERTDGE